jgi:hypothetical protein
MRQAARREYERRYTAESNYCALMAIYERVLILPAEESITKPHNEALLR